MSARAEIARAASGVVGVNVTANYRQITKPGEGFVRWGGRSQGDDGFGWMDAWEVWLVLPQDLTAAETWVADNLDDLLEALDAEMVVTSATPAELLPGPGAPAVNGLIITGARASGD